MKLMVHLLVAAAFLSATTCVSAAEIVVAQIIPLSGPVASAGSLFAAGASLYIDDVNLHGGIKGQQIRHLKIDDKYDVATSTSKLRELLNSGDLPTVLMTFGTQSSLAAVSELNARGVSLPVFPTGSGATALRRPFDRNLFNVRSSYSTEFARLIEALATIGTTSFTIVYQDDAFGKDGLAAAQQKLIDLKLAPAHAFKHNRDQQDISNLVPDVKKTESQVVLLATTATASTSFIKRAHEMKLATRIASISDLDPGDLVRTVGVDAAKGVMLSQSLPDPISRKLPMVADYNRLIEAAGNKLPRNALTLEGYIQARVIVEGMRKTPNLTAVNLIKTFESFADLNLGGYKIRFSNQSHEGAAYVDIAIISSDGRVVR